MIRAAFYLICKGGGIPGTRPLLFQPLGSYNKKNKSYDCNFVNHCFTYQYAFSTHSIVKSTCDTQFLFYLFTVKNENQAAQEFINIYMYNL